MDFLHLIPGTIFMRPYVFLFFAAFLLVAVPHLGWKRVMSFTVIGYLIAFCSEYASIHTGFPYGWYSYIDKTSSLELWVAGVPFFDSLSFVFLCYCSFATALFILSPLKTTGRGSLLILETRALRGSLSTLMLGALLQTYLDIIIDPVALRGERWFLGKFYTYHEVGPHFGIPLTNYVGWFFVSLVMIYVLQRMTSSLGLSARPPAGVCYFRNSGLLPVLLYLGIMAFNLTIALMIGEETIAVTGILTVLLPFVMVSLLAYQRLDQHSRKELDEHLRDIPWSPAGGRSRTKTVLKPVTPEEIGVPLLDFQRKPRQHRLIDTIPRRSMKRNGKINGYRNNRQ